MRESSPRLIRREKAVAEMQRSFLRGKSVEKGRISVVQPLSLTSFDSSPCRGASGEEAKLHGMPRPPLDRSNGDDRRQRRKQGGAVGAAASRMQATAKQTLGAATRAVALRSNDGEGKDADEESQARRPYRSDKGPASRNAAALSQLACPLRRFAPALPKGEPQAERLRFAVPFCEFVENARFG